MGYPSDDLTFAALRRANVVRCEGSFHGLAAWNPSEWTNALAGEAGEACNLTKKLRRGEAIDARAIGDELADVVIYADLAAARLGLRLDELVREKFNRVSERVGSQVTL